MIPATIQSTAVREWSTTGASEAATTTGAADRPEKGAPNSIPAVLPTVPPACASAVGDNGAMAVDRDQLPLFQLHVWKFKEGEIVSLMIHLGDRLGLYRELAGAGPVTVAEVA